jgi:hypothetical protein
LIGTTTRDVFVVVDSSGLRNAQTVELEGRFRFVYDWQPGEERRGEFSVWCELVEGSIIYDA